MFHHRCLVSLLKGVDFIRKEINNNKKSEKVKFGKLNVHRYKKGNNKFFGGHFHVVVGADGDDFVSVGLTSDKPNNKKNQSLHLVYESNGKIARMKRDATIDNKKAYDSKPANFHIDEESEKIAYEKGMRKLAKKKQGTN